MVLLRSCHADVDLHAEDIDEALALLDDIYAQKAQVAGYTVPTSASMAAVPEDKRLEVLITRGRLLSHLPDADRFAFE